MEELFAYGYYQTKEQQSNRTDNRGNGSDITEPIQSQYLLLTLEQYNKIAEYFMTVGNSVVKNTDLISELPTHRDLNNLTVQTLIPYLTEMRKITADKMDSIEYSTKDKLSKQTDSLKEQLHKEINRMLDEMKAKDLTPWKLKLKWAAVGAILPSMLCILQLILR